MTPAQDPKQKGEQMQKNEKCQKYFGPKPQKKQMSIEFEISDFFKYCRMGQTNVSSFLEKYIIGVSKTF